MTEQRLRLDPPGPARPTGPTGPGGPYEPADDHGVGSWLEERLLNERIVLLQGAVSTVAANRAAAALLTLDALGTDPVRLHMTSGEGDLTAVFALVDALDVMRAPVHAVAVGEVGEAALGVYAAARRRLAYPHARFRLAEPKVVGVAGTAEQVASAAGRYLQALEDLVVRVAQATGRPRSRVEDDFAATRILDATEAKEYGLVDEVIAPHR
jgi:ATP-dependent Clp protease protease subunit